MTTGIRLLAKSAPYATLLSAIGNKYRTAIVDCLLTEPSTPSELSRRLAISSPLVTHHIMILFHAGWVKRMQIGKRVTYSLNKKAFDELKRVVSESPFWKQEK